MQCFLNIKDSVEHIDWIGDSVYALTETGILYKGKFNEENITVNNSILESSDGFIQEPRHKRDLNQHLKLEIHLTRVPKIDCVFAFKVDESNESFVALQGNSMEDIDRPQLSGDVLVLKDLLNEASEADTLHDVVFHVSWNLRPFFSL